MKLILIITFILIIARKLFIRAYEKHETESYNLHTKKQIEFYKGRRSKGWLNEIPKNKN